MKVIDLLNKIANGEEVPKKFNFAQQTFTRKGSYIEDEDGDSIFESMCTDFSNINEEVEIIEEEKEIERITSFDGDKAIITIVNTLNKVIDTVNELNKKK